MAGQKYSAHGTTVSVNSVLVEGLTNIQIGGGTTGEVDTTDSDSGGVKEFVQGLRDNGTLTLTMRHIPGAAGQANLKTLANAGTTIEVVVTLPTSATTSSDVATITFDAYVQQPDQYNLPTAEDTAAERTATLRISGAITEAVA